MSTHARLSPSDKAWPHCPGSVRENAAYPDIPGEAALSGTGSHLLLEMCMKNGTRAEAYVGQIIGINHEEQPGGWTVDSERAARVQQCLDYITTRVKALKGFYPDCKITVEAESKSNPGALCNRDDWNGTCDITITVINAHGFCVYLEVIDYKDGREWVDVQDNSQLLAYLYGKMAPHIKHGGKLAPERISDTRQTIVQPKCHPPVRYVDLTGVAAFEAFYDLAEAAAATDDPNAPLIPDGKRGKGHCRWCKHGRAGNCAALNNNALQEANNMPALDTTTGHAAIFELTTVAEIERMSDAALAQLFDREAPVMQVFTHIKAEIEKRVKQRGMNGFEMGDGRGSNVYVVKEEEVAKRLKAARLSSDTIWQKKLISPAQLMKLPDDELSPTLKKKLEKELITFKAGEKGKTLLRVAYKNEKPSIEEMFGARAQLPDFSGEAPNFLEEQPPSFM